MLNNKSGIITIKIMIIFAYIFTLFAVLFDILMVNYGENTLLRNQKYQLESKMSLYNTYLNVNYGLYGINEEAFNFDIDKAESSLVGYQGYNQEIRGTKSLAEYAVVKNQILDYMKFRLPINYLDQVLTKLDVVSKSKASSNVLNLKTEVDEALGMIEHKINTKILLSYRVNTFTEKSKGLFAESCMLMNDKWFKLHNEYDHIKRSIKDSEKKIKNLDIKRINLESEIKKNKSGSLELLTSLENTKEQIIKAKIKLDNTLDEKESMFVEIEELHQQFINADELIERYIEYNKSLIKALMELEKNASEVFKLMNETSDNLRSNKEFVLDEIAEYVSEELAESKILINEHLVYEQYEIDYVKFESIMEDTENILKQYEMTAELKSIIYLIKVNVSTLEKIQGNLKFSPNISFGDEIMNNENKIDIKTISEIKTYFNKLNLYQNNNRAVDEEKKLYYEEQSTKTEEEYDAKVKETKKIGKRVNLYSSSDEGGVFWDCLKVIKNTTGALYESVSLNEYIISTFTAASIPSVNDFNFFDKYNRAHYMNRGEVEYILFGNRNESVNIVKTSGVIFGVRTIMNGLHVYTDKEKLLLSEAIGVAVAGWTGLGAPIASNVVRIGWSVGESLLDMGEIFKGESVPFYKIYPDQWKLDLGIAIPKSDKVPNIELINFSYHDYLRFMLLTINEKVKVERIMDIISLNLSIADYNPLLESYLTTLEIDSEVTIRTLFLDLNKYNNLKNTMEMSY